MASVDLQALGLISGLSTSDVVAKLMEVERLPLASLQRQKDRQQQKLDALRLIRTRLNSLLAKMQVLTRRSTIDAKTVSTDTPSTSPAIVTATANSDAALGSFTLRVLSLATPTTVTSATGPSAPAAIGQAVAADQPLASAGFIITPTTGTFSVNGVQVSIDSSTVLSDGVDAVGANTIFAKIRDATSSLDPGKQVTVSWGLDANGRQNKLVLTASDAIQLGAGSDTSNFLTAAGLSGLPPATSMTSSRNLGGVRPNELLNSSEANLDVALSATTGSFKINGVEISYDATVDTLNSVISRINSSSANVTAAFDSVNDRLTITSRNTGSTLIDLEDVSGNFLAAMKIAEGNEVFGTNASYLLNEAQRYSSSNTVADAIPGVTLSLKRADASTDVTLTVGQDTSAAITAVQDFIKEYNSAIDLIREKTAYDATLKQGGVLMGDSTISSIERTMATLVGGVGDGLSSTVRSFSDIGITTGSIGAAVGSTRNLVLNESKFTSALQSNPSAVADVFAALVGTASLSPGGTGSIESISGQPSNHVSGTYSIVSDASGNLTVTFTPSGGGSSITSTGTITAGGTNASLIPGVTLTAKPTLSAGTDSITASFTQKGVGVKIADYLSSLVSSTGLLTDREESSSERISEMNKSIERMQDRLEEKEKALYARFRAMEVALARLQAQSSSIASQLAQFSGGQ